MCIYVFKHIYVNEYVYIYTHIESRTFGGFGQYIQLWNNDNNVNYDDDADADDDYDDDNDADDNVDDDDDDD